MRDSRIEDYLAKCKNAGMFLKKPIEIAWLPEGVRLDGVSCWTLQDVIALLERR